MIKSSMTRTGKTLTTALLAGTALTTAAWAQFGGGGPMVPPAPTGVPTMGMPTGGGPSGVPMSGRPNMTGGSPFGMGRLPFANGTVTAVDAASGTVTLSPMYGGGAPQTVRVTGETKITATRAGTVGDLKVGDTIQVQGVPTGITATQITAGDSADMAGGGMGMMPGMMLTGPRLGAGQPGMGGARAASAQATGTITGLSPLTVSVSEGVLVTLKVGPAVKVNRNVSEKIGDLKAGDRVMANGKAGDDGVLAASRIRVNADSGMGFGMGLR